MRHLLRLSGFAPFIAVLLLWALAVAAGAVKPFFLPSPVAVAQAIFDLFFKYAFWQDVLVTMLRVSVGFAISAVFALPIGFAMGLNTAAKAFLEPFIDFIRYTPTPAYVPLFILWFGVGELEKTVIIFSVVFFQLVLMVASSVSLVPREIREFATVLGVKKKSLFLEVILPHASPRILSDLRISMGWAWSGIMLAEIVGSNSGIGYVIIQSQRLLLTQNVIAAIIVVGIIGVAIDSCFRWVDANYFYWKEVA